MCNIANGTDSVSRVIASRTILSDIEDCKALKYDNCIIEGKLDIKNAEINQDLHFNNTKFLGPVNFASNKINRNVFFIGSQFQDSAKFDGTQFNGFSVYWNSTFSGDTSFNHAEFNNIASFFDANFEEDVSFTKAKFNKDVWFWSAKFEKTSSFNNVIFAGHANFLLTQFINYSSFAESHFKGGVVFEDTYFNDVTSFYKALFKGATSFKDAEFNKNANFRKTEFEGPIDLTELKFTHLEINWDSIKGNHLICDSSTYRDLIKNFNNLEQFSDSDECYYQYRDQNKAGFIDYIAWLSCGYGVKPEYTLICSLLIIPFFGGIFLLRKGLRKIQPGADWEQETSIVDNLYFSLVTFFPATATPSELFPIGSNKYIASFEKILGWLLLALFLVTWNHVMLRPSI